MAESWAFFYPFFPSFLQDTSMIQFDDMFILTCIYH